MSKVYHQRETIKRQSVSGANSQLDELRSALIAKHDLCVKAGHIQDLTPINQALAQLDASSKNLSQTEAVAGSQAHAAQARQVINPVSDVISKKEVSAIKSIRGVSSEVIPTGKRFASMNGREPSNASYMRTNIKGLFDLVATKNA